MKKTCQHLLWKCSHVQKFTKFHIGSQEYYANVEVHKGLTKTGSAGTCRQVGRKVCKERFMGKELQVKCWLKIWMHPKRRPKAH